VIKNKITIFIALIALVLLLPNTALAFQLIPPGCTGENVTAQTCGLTQIFQTFINFANFLLSIVGSVTLLMFVYGGFTWLTSAGNSEKIKRGTSIMTNTAIGLVIVLGAATVIYSVGTFLCGDNQACIRQLNIYSPSANLEGGVDCSLEENDGKSCGTEKNMKCSYELRKCVTACEADENLRARGFACQNVPISEKTKENALAYAEANSCVLNLCPGGWDNLCCPSGQAAITTCCKCEINPPGGSPQTYYLVREGGECVTACTSMAQLQLDLRGDTTTNPASIIDVIPGVTREEESGCDAALREMGL